MSYTIRKSSRLNTKYLEAFSDGHETLHFDDARFQHYQDKTLYSCNPLDHADQKDVSYNI